VAQQTRLCIRRDSETAPSLYAPHHRGKHLTNADESKHWLQAYPEADTTLIDLDLEQQFELLIGTIRTIRNLREADIKPGVKVTVILQSEQPGTRNPYNQSTFRI